MAYNITLSNGTDLISGGLTDGTIDTTSSSLTLVGKNYPGYGTFLNQNFVQLMENFAKASAPAAPLPGQLWWDSGTKALKVNVATTKGTANQIWRSIVTSSSTSSAPSNPVLGEQWWDTANGQLKVWSGSAWVVVGPVAATSAGNTGALPDTISVQVGEETVLYVVLKFFIDNTLLAIWTKETLIDNTNIPGFQTLRAGLNLNTNINQRYYGNADVALGLSVNGSAVPSESFLRNDQNGTINGSLILNSDAGLKLGIGNDFEAFVTGDNVNLRNATINGDMVFSIRQPSGYVQFLRGSASSGLPEAYASTPSGASSLTLVTKDYVDSKIGGGTGTTIFTSNVVPGANLTYNIGSPTLWWNNIYGVSIQAKYADLAERFRADAEYSPGTVVELGGPEEITAAAEELSEDVFGVISTKAAYLMNAGAGDDSTHPPVAVQGRVPVKVIGKIRKGDRLVAAGNGLARAGAKTEINAWNVIGRSLENKFDDDEGTVEAIVKLNS